MTTDAALPARDLRIDFFRGLALLFIFWDHVPGNVFGHLTIRNFGFSDATETFVFLAGYSAALAYRARYATAGYRATALHILRRASVLYAVHVFLLVLLIALVLACSGLVASRDFVHGYGLSYFLASPASALTDGLLLRFMPAYTDVLPLYIVLLVALAGMLPLIRHHPLRALSLAVLVYLVARAAQWNLVAQPGGVWFFNPFAWQLLFVLGLVAGSHRGALARALHRAGNRWRLALWCASIGYLVFALLIALSWSAPQWHDRLVPDALARAMYPIDKVGMSPLRVLHFLALAWWVSELLPAGAWLTSPLARGLRTMGRHSLVVFCVGVLLVPLADVLNSLHQQGLAIQTLTSLGGWAVMSLAAVLPERVRREQRAKAGALVASDAQVWSAGQLPDQG